MRTALCLISCITAVGAFKNLGNTVRPVIRGPTAPLENIDLFDVSTVAKNAQPSFLREAELKHGRLAMLAALAIPGFELFYHDLGINQFQALPNTAQVVLVMLMYVSEMASIYRGWQDPTVKPFTLKEDYQPGDLGFGLWDPEDGVLMDKELNNGRLAMIGVLGMMVQELVTNQPLF